MERIDLATDTTANTLKLRLNDVLDMAGMNLFNNTNGWTGLAASVGKHQVVVDGTSADTLSVVGGAAWTQQAGTASSSISGAMQTYNVWNHNTSAAQLLSNLSNFVGVVMAPKRSSVFHHIEFLRLSDKRVLVIIVTPDGDVQNRVIFTDTDFSQSQLVEASNYLNANFAGMAIDQVRERLQAEVDSLRSEIAAFMQAAVNFSSEALVQGEDEVVINGKTLRDIQESLMSFFQQVDPTGTGLLQHSQVVSPLNVFFSFADCCLAV